MITIQMRTFSTWDPSYQLSLDGELWFPQVGIEYFHDGLLRG